MAERNTWGVRYSMIIFFEKALHGHSKVAGFQRNQDIYFHIDRVGDLPPVRVVLLDEYTLGIADVLKAQAEFPGATCIVTGANWNGYTREAREYGEANGIGVFVLGEFMGALFLKNPHKYIKKDSDGQPIFYYKNS